MALLREEMFSQRLKGAKNFPTLIEMKFLHLFFRLINHLTKRKMSKYPRPAYHFIVEWGGQRAGFTEVTGLNITHEVIEYREGNSPQDFSSKIPGITKYDNIVLKRGIMAGDNDFFNWINTKQNSQIQRRDITISLLDEQHAPIIVWKVRNAFPVKYSGPELNARASEVAIETLELAHEGIEIETA